MTSGLVHLGYSLPEGQAEKLNFFGPWVLRNKDSIVFNNIYIIYNKILDFDWFCACLFVAWLARDHVDIRLQESNLKLFKMDMCNYTSTPFTRQSCTVRWVLSPYFYCLFNQLNLWLCHTRRFLKPSWSQNLLSIQLIGNRT